jgi:copper chaperone
MKQADENSRNGSAVLENTGLVEKAVKSSGGCCCGGGSSQTIKIGRDKPMNEVRENSKTVTTLTAPEIVCGGCASSIKKALGAVSGVSEVDVDVATKKVTVNHSEDVSHEKIVDALDRAGYSVA